MNELLILHLLNFSNDWNFCPEILAPTGGFLALFTFPFHNHHQPHHQHQPLLLQLPLQPVQPPQLHLAAAVHV